LSFLLAPNDEYQRHTAAAAARVRMIVHDKVTVRGRHDEDNNAVRALAIIIIVLRDPIIVIRIAFTVLPLLFCETQD
jgi:hypothetical protein